MSTITPTSLHWYEHERVWFALELFTPCFARSIILFSDAVLANVACGPIGKPCFLACTLSKPIRSAVLVCGPCTKSGIHPVPKTFVSAPETTIDRDFLLSNFEILSK